MLDCAAGGNCGLERVDKALFPFTRQEIPALMLPFKKKEEPKEEPLGEHEYEFEISNPLCIHIFDSQTYKVDE